MDLLKIKYRHPLEREYEGWIISGIEEYFETIGKQFRIFAISPIEEKSWPLDEVVSFDYKLIGLQLKRLLVGPGNKIDSSRLNWDLSNKIQFDQIKVSPNIYFCLPTFLNRDFKKVALHHTIFWRPEDKDTHTNYWYDNPRAKGEGNQSINDRGIRWGGFIEKVLACEIGAFSQAGKLSATKLLEILEPQELKSEVTYSPDIQNKYQGIYALAIEL